MLGPPTKEKQACAVTFCKERRETGRLWNCWKVKAEGMSFHMRVIMSSGAEEAALAAESLPLLTEDEDSVTSVTK